MMTRHQRRLVHEGNYVAEVDFELVLTDDVGAPYLALDDAYKLDDVREPLRRSDIRTASRLARVYALTPVEARPTGDPATESGYPLVNRLRQDCQRTPDPGDGPADIPRPPQSAEVKKVLILGLFALAMGYLEAAVVVYLRQIYYPQGFGFPLNDSMLKFTLLVEAGRELATIIMLAVIAVLSGRSRLERFAWFLFVFGTWDCAYYLGLKALLNWPPSLLTWDILFLIPFPWAAPVLSAVLVAASMVAMGLLLVRLNRTGRTLRLRPGDWLAVTAGIGAILWSFLSSYGAKILGGGILQGLRSVPQGLSADVAAHVPGSYPWWLLTLGLATVWAVFLVRGRAPSVSGQAGSVANGCGPSTSDQVR